MKQARLRWLVVALGAAAFWITFFHRVAPGTIANELQSAFAVSGAALGALAATYFYIYALMQVPTGVLVDTLGPRKVLTVGGLIAGVGSMLFGMADNVIAAAAGRTLAGLGVSVAFVSALKLNAAWFEERYFATAASLTNLVGLSGALTATVPLAWLLTQTSWRNAFVAIGAASFVIALLTWWLLHDQPATRTHGAPREHTADAAPGARWYHGLGEVARNRATWTGFWMGFGLSGSFMSFVGLWGVPMLVHGYGLTAVDAGYHTAAILIAVAVSSTVISVISDRLRRRRLPAIILSASYCGAWALWLYGVPGASTWAMFVLTGLCASGFVLAWSYAKEVNRPRYSGMGISLANTGGFLAAGILQPLVGWVLDRTADGGVYTIASFRAALAVLLLFALSGFVATLFMRETHCRNIWKEKSVSEEPL